MYEEYVKSWEKYLVDKWQLASEFAPLAARLIVYCHVYGLRPIITSGYRSPEQQQVLVDEWKKGNPNVTTPLPPGKSLHQNKTWYGKPASLAMDMVVNNYEKAGIIAKYFKVAWAGPGDKVHFAYRRGTL